MFSITVQDLIFRRRQFLIAVIGAGMVFAMTLLLSGLAAAFSGEIARTVNAVGADRWILPAGTTGPFSSFSAMPAATVDQVRGEAGVTQSDPLVVIPETAVWGSHAAKVTVLGHRIGGLADIAPSSGRAVRADGEAVVDGRLAAPIGTEISLAGHTFRVVGQVHGKSLFGGSPNVYVGVADAQALAFGGRSLVTTVLTRGVPVALPAGLTAVTSSHVRSDTARQMKSAVASISNSRSFMWIVAAVIVAALMFVSALERVRDFAVLKSLGASSSTLFAGVALQAVIVALIAAAAAAVIANFLKPLFAVPVAIPTSAFLYLPLAAVIVGLLSSLVALRRAVGVDPAAAFAGA